MLSASADSHADRGKLGDFLHGVSLLFAKHFLFLFHFLIQFNFYSSLFWIGCRDRFNWWSAPPGLNMYSPFFYQASTLILHLNSNLHLTIIFYFNYNTNYC